MASNEAMNEQPEFFGIIDVNKCYLYEELWKSCAGPLVDLPAKGSKVYYFPQGHLEHVNASTNEDLDMVAPLFDLPSKLRCDVMDIQLKAEKDTDEVYAQIKLIPDTIQIDIPIPDRNRPRPTLHSFTKVLTASDTSTHNGLSIPRKHATKCLPLLDMTQPIPSQELMAKDLHDYEWRFKHIYRGTPQRHLFTSGWNAFATAKRLAPGDSFVFLRGGNGELQVGIRRAVRQQCNIPSSIMSTECMHHGIIASTMHVINNHSLFTVMYKPRISQFVVSFDKYVDAMNNKFNIGSRFCMRFESEDFTEKRYSGTIIGVQDFSPHWKDSEWRSLEVQWDDHASIPRPSKVSPWEIEPLAPLSNVPQPSLLKNKRSRQVNETGSTSSNTRIPTLNQGREIGQSSMSSKMGVPKLNYHNVLEDSKISSGWIMSNYPNLTIPKPNNNDQMVMPMKERITIDATTNFKLFGVDLAATPTEANDPARLIDSYQKSEISKLFEEKKIGQNQIMTSPKEVQRKQVNSIRSRTKVHMQGVAIGRAVDLTLFDGYNPLIDELEKLFDLKGELQTRNQWEIFFTDNVGDMMLVGDDPWLEFCDMVKKIFICSKEYVKKMKSWNKCSERESTILACSDIPPNVKNQDNNLLS